MSTTNSNEELELLRRFFDESEKITDSDKKKDMLNKSHDLFTKIIERDSVQIREDGKSIRQEKATKAENNRQDMELKARGELYQTISFLILFLSLLGVLAFIQPICLRFCLFGLLVVLTVIFLVLKCFSKGESKKKKENNQEG